MATDNESTDPDDFRRRIYEAMDDPELSLAEKRERALSLGREYPDVENGHINRLTGTETFETVASVGGGVEMVPTGETLDRANTYCRRTVEASSPIALSNAPEQGWGDDPAYREFGLECYLGTTIFVRGDLYGTLCFASRSVRNAAFTVGEKTFVELIARLLGREIEAARHDRELEARDRALERSENKYQALLQAAPDAILLVDADTGEIVGANEKAVELTGYAGAELEAMRVAELVPEERRERYAEFLRDGIDETCRERFDDGVSLRIRRAGGSDVPVEVSGSTVEVNDMNVVQTVVRDISDRRERAQELERSRELLRQTQNAVNLGGWEVDLRTESLNWTDEVYRIYDLPVESDLTVEEAMEFFHPEDRPEVEDAFERVETEGETYNLEVRLVTASDEVRWVRTIGLPQYDDSGDDVVAVQGVFQDISDRKERERDLRIKNRAVEEASVGIAISDATVEELPVLYANREFERLTGYDSETVLGRSPGFLHGPETDQAAVESVREALDSHEPVTTELLHYRADGMPFWDELTVTPVTDEHGDVTHFVSFHRDVTAKKRRERSLSVLDRVLRHNLRNDMGVVRGHAEIIADQTDGKVAESATRIGETANDLTALTEKARELESAMRNIAPVEPRDLGTDIETVIEDLRTDYPDAEFRVDGLVNGRVLATERLRLALRELGENAAKHGGSSPVTYRVEPTEEGTVAVRVSDDGPGLSEAEQWVVETGRETALEHGGGLGLWLVNWIVTGVGGDVTTTVDDGTTVTVRLQLAADVDTEGLDYHRHAALSTIPE